MPVVLNAATATAGTSSAPTRAHNPQGVDRALLVAIVWIDPAGVAAMVGGPTFSGAPLTELGAAQIAGSATLQVYRLAAPAAVNADVVFNFDAPVDFALIVASYTGAHQVLPTGTPVIASATSAAPSVTVPGTVSGNMVFDAVGVMAISATIAATPGVGQVKLDTTQNFGTSPRKIALAASQQGAGGNVVMAWTLSLARAWAQKAVEIVAAPQSGAYRRSWTGFRNKFGSPGFGGG